MNVPRVSSNLVLAVVALGVALGVNTAVFSVARDVLLPELPFQSSERLVRLWEVHPIHASTSERVSELTFVEWQRRLTSFDVLAATDAVSEAILSEGDRSTVVREVAVTDGFFALAGVPPPGRPGAGTAVSQDVWRWLGSGRKTELGGSASLYGVPITIDAVMPSDFGYPYAAQVWTRRSLDREIVPERRPRRSQIVIARLRPGVSLTRARAELQLVSQQLAEEYPSSHDGWRADAMSLREFDARHVRPALLLLLSAVILALLLTALSVSTLLLNAWYRRAREVCVRLALGATRADLVRAALGQSLGVAVLAGAIGVSVAEGLLRVLSDEASALLAMRVESSLSLDVWAYASAATLACAVAVSLVPTLFLSSVAPAPALNAFANNGLVLSGQQWRTALVVLQTVLTGVALTGVFALGLQYRAEVQRHLGFEPDRILAVPIRMPLITPGDPPGRYASERFSLTIQEAAERISTLPGVNGASGMIHVPFAPLPSPVAVRGGAPDAPAEGVQLHVVRNLVLPDAFRLLQIQRIAGSDLYDSSGRPLAASSQRPGQPHASRGVAVVSASLARRLTGTDDAVGRIIVVDEVGVREREIVGVVADVRYGSDAAEALVMYVPYTNAAVERMTLLASHDESHSEAAQAIRSRLEQMGTRLAIADIVPLEAIVSKTVAPQRFTLLVMAALALMAVLTAAVGTWALVSETVARRRRELGIRLALGARPASLISGTAMRGSAAVSFGAVLAVIIGVPLYHTIGSVAGMSGIPALPAILPAAGTLLCVGLLASCAAAFSIRGIEPRDLIRSE